MFELNKIIINDKIQLYNQNLNLRFIIKLNNS